MTRFYEWADRWVPDWFWFRVWNPVHSLMLRLHLVDCLYCNNSGDGCDCGVDGVPYEVSGGAHYLWCMFYNGCRMCGRTAK